MTAIVKPLSAKSRGFIKDMMEGKGLDGECYALAIVLSQELGWPIIGLMQNKEIRHAVVRNPGGGFWDARGAVNEKNLGQPFGLEPPYDLRSVTEEDLFAVRPIEQASMAFVLRIAQALWPALPWKSRSQKDRILSFVSELEALSQKHNLWLYGSTPTSLPRIAEGDGDETGYEATTTIDGLNYMVNRIIGK